MLFDAEAELAEILADALADKLEAEGHAMGNIIILGAVKAQRRRDRRAMLNQSKNGATA